MYILKEKKNVNGKDFLNFYLVIELPNGNTKKIAIKNVFKDDFKYLLISSKENK